jgi:DNA polymerase-3 subunit alpha
MAAVLSNNMNDIKQVTFFMEECRRMGLTVLGPDVNESFYKFTVNDKQAIRFGMGAIKGVGRGAVETIIEHRKEARYTSVFDLTKRIDLRAANKKALENLTLAGGLDSFGNCHRAQYFNPDGDGVLFLEKAIRYGTKHQENLNSSQTNLFGDDSQEQIQEIQIPDCDAWGTLELLKKEKDVVGIYISAHPLDDFKREMKYFSSATFDVLSNLDPLVNRELSFGGIINDVEHLITKTGKGWGKFTIEDFSDQYEFRIFGEEYLKFRHFILPNNFVRLRIRVAEGWRNRETGQLGQPRIQFNSFEMLQDTLKTNIKKITLILEVNQLNEVGILDLKNTVLPFKGDKGFYIDLFDTEEKIKLTLPSRKQRVEVSNELLSKLEEKNIPYRIN